MFGRSAVATVRETVMINGSVLMHILLIEDDVQLGRALKHSLERLRYTVSWIRDGRTAIAALGDQTVDLALLDLGLPGCDGIEVLTETRRSGGDVPVLILTARDSPVARVHGLDAGADDYLIKPFHFEELAARIRSLARRRRGLSVNRFEVGSLVMEMDSATVTFRGAPVVLTKREFALLQVLMESAGRLMRREAIENSVYGFDDAVGSGALDLIVHSLRRKLDPSIIRNVRGFGFMLVAEPR